MSQSTTTNQKEQSNTPDNASETLKKQSGEELLHKEDIPNTPFTLVHTEELGWFVAIGGNILTKPTNTRKEAIYILNNEPYNVMLHFIHYMMERYNDWKTLEMIQDPK